MPKECAFHNLQDWCSSEGFFAKDLKKTWAALQNRVALSTCKVSKVYYSWNLRQFFGSSFKAKTESGLFSCFAIVLHSSENFLTISCGTQGGSSMIFCRITAALQRICQVILLCKIFCLVAARAIIWSFRPFLQLWYYLASLLSI